MSSTWIDLPSNSSSGSNTDVNIHDSAGNNLSSTGTSLDVNVTNTVPVTFATPTTSPTIFNVSVPLANTEVSQSLPANTKKIMMKCRGSAITQFSFASGQSGTLFITLYPGSVYSEIELNLPSSTIYFQTSLPSQVMEILTWS